MKYVIMALTVMLAAMIFILEVSKAQATFIQIHQIVIEDHEGNVIYSEYFAEGADLKAFSLPEAPIRPGYTFIGWSADLPEEMPEHSIVIVPTYIQHILSLDITL
ncbi:MAG: hypothetical protein WC992_01185 [Acholeplasmataceae bacterium]|jgi:hypothetical protein|nr:hypothetical protein [Acholeplasmataceae bacterium]